MRVVVAVADAMAMREARRMADLLQRLAQLEEARRVLREFGEAGFLDPAIAIDDGVADRRQRQADELAVARGVAFRAFVPAAIFAAEIVGEVGDVEQLVGILMRVVEPDQHEVGAGADIGGDRSLRANVLPAFLVDADLHAGGFGEALGVGQPLVLVALDEGRPAQQPQRSAGLGRVSRVLGEGGGAEEPASHDARRGGGSRADHIASGEFHRHFLLGFPRSFRVGPSGSACEPLSGFSVEQMDQAGLGGQPHGLARLE